MWNPVVILVLCLCSLSNAVPLGLKKNMDIVVGEDEPMLMLATDEEARPEAMISRLNLPSNATSIRADITDGFSCDNKTYGYYADVENECQIFHVCLPVTYADGKENTFRWSFICPEETVFSQDSFTCMRPEDMSIDCEESFKYYELNRNFGVIESEDVMPSEEDEMSMEDMSRKPPNLDLQEDNMPSSSNVPVKKQTIKVQNSNRRKTQTNRINDGSQRRKIPPARKTPAVPAITAKPVEEEAPIVEQEVERTTIKYQRFTKRPTNLVKEPSKIELNPPATKPTVPKPEQQLYTQKRKRPQVYSATRFDAAIQPESEPEPEASEKSEPIPESKPAVPNQAEAQAEAQASEIAEVSIKPQVEKVAEPKPTEPEVDESLILTKNEPEVKPEVEPLPENTQSRAEVVEIPIQKVDQPLVVEAPVVMAPVPEEPKLSTDAEESLKAEEEKMEKEELQAEKVLQAELTKAIEEEMQKEAQKSVPETPEIPEKPLEAEKVLFEPMPEAIKLPEIQEPEKVIEAVKTADIASEPSAPEEVKMAEPVMEPEAPVAEAESAAPVIAPVVPQIMETKPNEPEVLRSEGPAPLENQIPEKPVEVETPADQPEIGQHKVEQPMTEEEAPALAPEMPLGSEMTAPETPLIVELPVSPSEESEKMAPVPQPESEKPLESEVPATPDMEMTRLAEVPKVPEEAPLEKPAEPELPAEPMKAQDPEPQMPAESEAEPAVQQPAAVQPQPSVEEDSLPAASDTEDTQSMILDFIASLVNSENSNLRDQPGVPDQMQAEPESTSSEGQKFEQRYPVPQYIPMMENNEAMYQIPVQVIETPEPESQPPAPAPEATRSELPMPAVVAPEVPEESQMMTESEAEPESAMPSVTEMKLPLRPEDIVELVKGSLDIPAQKENLVQEPAEPQNQLKSEMQADSTEVRPIYHRYVEFGSNLLKPEPLSASDEEEPKVISDSAPKEVEQQPQPTNSLDAPAAPELPKAADLPSQPEQLASEQQPALNILAAPADALLSEPASLPSDAERLAMSRSLNHFKMDPRKRRFLFRSDAS